MRAYPIFTAFVLSGIAAIVPILVLNSAWLLWKSEPTLQTHRQEVYLSTIGVMLRSVHFVQLSAFIPFLRHLPHPPENKDVAGCSGVFQILGEQRYFYGLSAAYTVRFGELWMMLDDLTEEAQSLQHLASSEPDTFSRLLGTVEESSQDSREALLQLTMHIDLCRTSAIQINEGVLRALRVGRIGFTGRDLHAVDMGRMLSFSLDALATCVRHTTSAAHNTSQSLAALRQTVVLTRHVMEETGICSSLHPISPDLLARPGNPPRATGGLHRSCSLLERNPPISRDLPGGHKLPVSEPSVATSLSFFEEQLEEFMLIALDVGESITQPLRSALADALCPLWIAATMFQTENTYLLDLTLWMPTLAVD